MNTRFVLLIGNGSGRIYERNLVLKEFGSKIYYVIPMQAILPKDFMICQDYSLTWGTEIFPYYIPVMLICGESLILQHTHSSINIVLFSFLFMYIFLLSIF